jgi:hypothetical protein
MHSGYKLRVVIFGTKRRRSLGNTCKKRTAADISKDVINFQGM